MFQKRRLLFKRSGDQIDIYRKFQKNIPSKIMKKLTTI